MDFSFLSPVVLCILVTETVERFAYFGFRAILVLYFIHVLEYSEETAIALFAFVTCLAYSSPIVGAILADAKLGRYRTILWFGWTYAVGLAILTAGASLKSDESLTWQRIFTFLGLFLVCLGTGGIKPCVSAFGADQVAAAEKSSASEHVALQEDAAPPHQASKDGSEQVRHFFASFYFCINLGAVTSISIIPIVKYHFGFGAAFGVTTVFITLAMLCFLWKRNEYVHHDHEGNSLSNTFSLCIWLVRTDLSKREWLFRICPCIAPKRNPLALDNQVLLQDAKQALRVMPVMSLFPIFWMLYDQQTSVWTLQATKLQLHGLQPEQLIIINPFEIMIFIPLFDRLIYPFLEYMGVNLPHLRRMRWGMVLAALAFSLSGFLESAIQRNPPNSISVAYQLPQITFLAIAEIFISVTGLEFAYSTSPERIKAFLMGMYLLTTAAGDLLGGILYSTFFQSLNRATVMHVCAGLMIVNLFIFCWVGQGWEEQRKRSDSGVELTSLKGDASEESLHSSRRKHKDLLLLEESIDSVR